MNEIIKTTKELAMAIIDQAIKDWRHLIKKDAYNQKYNELRRFFKSEWAKQLCDELGIEAKDILNLLEEERRNLNNKKGVS